MNDNNLLLFTNTEWNRKLHIEKHSFNGDLKEIVATIAINRPLDSQDDKSSSLAYPLSKSDCRAVIEVLEGILKNE